MTSGTCGSYRIFAQGHSDYWGRLQTGSLLFPVVADGLSTYGSTIRLIIFLVYHYETELPVFQHSLVRTLAGGRG